MYRFDIINHLIEWNNYKSYLEIGLSKGECFYEVKCENKEACDQYPNGEYAESVCTYKLDSDAMFSSIREDKKWDIIFIDGLHSEEMSGRDIINSLKHLNKGGKIVVHDVLPGLEENTGDEIPPDINFRPWNGNVYKTIESLNGTGINFYTVNTDFGVCVIDYFDNAESLNFLEKNSITFKEYDENWYRIMNVVSEEEFLRMCGNIKIIDLLFVTMLSRPQNLNAMAESIKASMLPHPFVRPFWLICKDSINCKDFDESRKIQELFETGIPFAWENVNLPEGEHFGGTLINEALPKIKNMAFRHKDPYIYILDDDNVVNEMLFGSVEYYGSTDPSLIVFTYFTDGGRIFYSKEINTLDPSAAAFKYHMFEKMGGFKGGIDYDYTSFTNLLRMENERVVFDDVFGDAYIATYNAIPKESDVESINGIIDEDEYKMAITFIPKHYKKPPIIFNKGSHISLTRSFEVIDKDSVKKVWDIIKDENKKRGVIQNAYN